jgi:hypothetical protein
MRYPAILIITLMAMSACVSTQNSNVKKGEDVTMKIDEQPDVIVLARLDNQGAGRGITDDLLGKGLSLAADGVKKLINIDKQKYTAEYSDGRNEMYFYNNVSMRGPLDPDGMIFNGVTVMRQVAKDKKVTSDTALYVFFDLDKQDPLAMINNGIFRLRTKELKLNYAKAKIPDVRGYMPWTWFNKKRQTINMDIQITINATWYSVDGTFHQNVPIGQFNLTLRDLPLERSAQQKFLKEKGILGGLIDGYSLMVPRSSTFIKGAKEDLIPAFGQGLYNINVNIKEASKQTFVVKSVYDNSDQLVDQLQKKLK